VNIDIQKAYTRTDLYKTAYETDPRQLDYVNALARKFRALNWPVVWTYVAYMESGEDAGIWGTRTDEKDVIYCKKMPSPFFETQLQSLCVWHQVDTVILTGGSTSGCIRAGAVDSLSRGYRTIVPEECVADKHESYHYANLTDLSLKYADVLEVSEVTQWLDAKQS